MYDLVNSVSVVLITQKQMVGRFNELTVKDVEENGTDLFSHLFESRPNLKHYPGTSLGVRKNRTKGRLKTDCLQAEN
jgi:hypothetical protein